MEIQKIFSEIDTDEKLYSVLMSEEELALFSEIQKEFASVRGMKKYGKRLVDEIAKGGGNIGRINASVYRNGYGRNLVDNTLNPGFKKASNGVANYAAKLAGEVATPELKNELYKTAVKTNIKNARILRKTGGKLGPGGTLLQ
jgi:hypothetical protein